MTTFEELLASLQPTEQDRREQRMQGLLTAGLSLMGAPKGRELQAAGQAGLLGMDAYRTGMGDLRKDKASNIALRKFAFDMEQQQQAQAELQRLREEQGQMRAAATASYQPAQPGSPPMGPPSPAGEMQPAVAPTPGGFDHAGYAQRLYGMGRVNEGMAVEKAMQRETPFDKPKPESWTPESLSRYAQSRNPADLARYVEPKEAVSPVSKVSPADFTPRSVAAFLNAGGTDHSMLVPLDKTPRTTVNVAAARPLPPKDHMWDESGRFVRPIPGSPAEREVATEATRGKVSLDDALSSTQRMRQSINEVRPMITSMTSGMGSLLTIKPGSDARNLQSKLTQIKSALAIEAIQGLKAASAQGASGFGALSEKELTVIESKIANIDQATSAPALNAALDAVDAEFARLEKRVIRARAAAILGGK